jgi:hypothetical protein
MKMLIYNDNDYYHVIEYSAFEQMRRERDEYANRMHQLSKELAEELTQERDKLTKERDRWYDEHQKVLDVKNELIAENKKLAKELAELRTKHEELLSYMPKVPTQPYERELAQQLAEARAEIERLKDELKGKYRTGNDVKEEALKEWGIYYGTGYGWRVTYPQYAEIVLVDKRELIAERARAGKLVGLIKKHLDNNDCDCGYDQGGEGFGDGVCFLHEALAEYETESKKEE